MADNKKSTIFVMTLLLAVFLQVLFVAADVRDTPSKATVRFAKAYLNLDADAVRKQLCGEMTQGADKDVVDAYIQRAAHEAHQRGYDLDIMKSRLYHVETHTLSRTDDTAKVLLTGRTRVNIWPPFTWVAQIFNIGTEYHVSETFDLVKEGKKWKVCGDLMVLPQSMKST